MKGRKAFAATAALVFLLSFTLGFLGGFACEEGPFREKGPDLSEGLGSGKPDEFADEGWVVVPSVIGEEAGLAAARIREAGLICDIDDIKDTEGQVGTVVSQSPEAGSRVKRGDRVRITTSGRTPGSERVVCLDPGHADTPPRIDEETGLNTQDWANEPEIRIVFDIANMAKEMLEEEGVKIVMTKSSVYEPVDLKQRAVIANQSGAALVLHIHTDPGIGVPTTFYPGGDADHNWKANSQTGRKAVIDPRVQAESERMARVFHQAMLVSLNRLEGPLSGSLRVEDRGATGTGNYGPLFSYDVWSMIPTFTIENNQSFADANRHSVARAIADGILECLKQAP